MPNGVIKRDKKKVVAITGYEPRRLDEYPMQYRVGDSEFINGRAMKISKIVVIEHQFCDWFHVYVDGLELAKISEHAIAQVTYKI